MQQVYNASGAVIKTTDYDGPFIYQGDTLQFINHEEGRIVMKNVSAPEYQYHLKDHLGNVRVTFTTTPAVKKMTAGFETPYQATEAGFFSTSSYPNASHINTVPTNAHSGSNSLYLNGSANGGQVGVAKTFSVMPGDVVSIQAYAKYNAATGTQSNLTGFAAALLSAFNLTAPVPGETGTARAALNTWGGGEAAAYGDGSNDNTDPRTFVTILMFDRNFVFQDVAYQQLTSSGVMNATYTAKQPGYAYIYVSNEEGTLRDVYVDDVTISQTQSPVVQQEDFYPFGLKFNSYSRENTLPNTLRLFQNQEHIDDLGLDWDSFKWRNHQPEIGRFFNVDPLAEKYVYNSPYAFSENQVVAHRELEGLEKWDIKYSDGSTGSTYGPLPNQQAAERQADNELMVSPLANSYVYSDVKPNRTVVVNGVETTKNHNGVDLHRTDGKTDGAPALVASNGKVVDVAKNTDSRGNTVTIQADKDGKKHVYMHMQDGSLKVENGQTVKRGQELGKVGNTGLSEAPHLHYEVRGKNGEVLKPTTENPAITNGSSDKKVVPLTKPVYNLPGSITIK